MSECVVAGLERFGMAVADDGARLPKTKGSPVLTCARNLSFDWCVSVRRIKLVQARK